MQRHWNRWLVVSIAVLALTGISQAQDKTPPKGAKTPPDNPVMLLFPPGKTAVQVNADLTKGDPTDSAGKHFIRFIITLTAGRDYRIHMKGNDKLDAFLRVEDAAGKVLAEDQFGEPGSSGVEFRPAKTAPYSIVCTSYKAGMLGSFTLSVAEMAGKTTPVPAKKSEPKEEPKTAKKPEPKEEPKTAPTPLAQAEALALDVDKPVTVQGKITAKDSKDSQGRFFKAFTFQAHASKSYQFEAKGQDSFNPQLRIENAGGQLLRGEDSFNAGVSRISYQPAQNGTLRLIVSCFDPGKTGSFTLTGRVVGPPPPNQPPTVAAMPPFQPVVRTEITSHLSREDGTDSTGKAYKVFTFQAKPNKMYIVEMSGHIFGAQLRIDDKSGKELKREDAFDGNYSQIALPPGKGGEFRVIASAVAPNQFGNFTLSITERDPVPPARQAVVFDRQSTINDRLTRDDGIDHQGKFHKVYVIKAQPGKSYVCDLRARDFDAELRLEDDKGRFVKAEDFGDRNVSQLSFKCDTAATYHLVVVASQPGRVGEFTLTIAERGKGDAAPTSPKKAIPAEGTAGTLQFTGGKVSVDSTITDKDARDAGGKFFKTYPFTAVKGKTYEFAVTGKGGLDPFVRVDDDMGHKLKEEEFGNGNVSRLLFHAYQGGAYRVIVTTFKPGQTGEFTLAAREVEVKAAKAEPLKLADGRASVQSELTASDAILPIGNKVYKEFTFAAEMGKTYKIDLHSKAFDAYLLLRDAAGKTVAKNDDAGPNTLDSRIVYTAPKAGTLHIIATSLNGGSGPFLLTVGEGTDDDKLMDRIDAIGTASAAERKQILADIEKHFKRLDGKLTVDDADLALDAAQRFEDTDKALAETAYTTLGNIFAKAKDREAAKEGKLMLNAVKRLKLVGNVMEVKGNTVDGKAFDLAKLKGKVVLVDFWATWCGPCVGELPNVRKLYAKYHDMGFDVIGISLDRKEDALTEFLGKEKLPWPSIYKEGNNIADDYGVFSIPLGILIGRDGRVVSLNARGAELDRLLAEQFAKKKAE